MKKSFSMGLFSILLILVANFGIFPVAYAQESFAVVAATKTIVKPNLSFGGRVAVALPCISILGPSYWVSLVPAPATKQPFYIWTPLTLRGVPPPGLPPLFPPKPTPDIPPPMVPGQEVLGLADIPYWCCLPPSVPAGPFICVVPPYFIVPPLLGQRMQWANQSLLPSTGAELAAAAAAAKVTVTAASTGISTAAIAAMIAAIAAIAVAASVSSKH